MLSLVIAFLGKQQGNAAKDKTDQTGQASKNRGGDNAVGVGGLNQLGRYAAATVEEENNAAQQQNL